jgi:hypothetical protein
MAEDSSTDKDAELEAASAQLIADMEALMQRAKLILRERRAVAAPENDDKADK